MTTRSSGYGLVRALSFLTPMGMATPPSPAAVPWFPVVGAAIGAALGGVWWGSDKEFGPAVAAVIVVACDLIFTGMLHMDGLADSADGLIPHVGVGPGPDGPGEDGDAGLLRRAESRQRRLEIMADPVTGAFGVIVVAVVLLARFAALASMRGGWEESVLLLGGLWCASRSLMAVGLLTMSYARPGGGLATSFTRRSSGSSQTGDSFVVRLRNPAQLIVVIVLLGGAFAMVVQWKVVGGPICLAAGLLAGGVVLMVAQRRIGGFTGDVLGAAGVILETVGLIVASARW